MEVTRRMAAVLAIVGCVVCAACSPRASTPASGSLDVRPIDAEGYRRFLEANHGKVVLVDFWATWCPSCVELLPHHVALAERFGKRGLVVATVAMDELANPDDPAQQAPVRAVLARRAAPLVHFIVRGAQPGRPDTDPFKTFGIPGGALPHLKLYDRSGALRRTFDSETEVIAPDVIDQAVEGSLGETR